MPGINEKLLHKIEVPIPSADKQSEMIRIIEDMKHAEDTLLAAIAASKDLVLSFVNAATAQR